MILGPTAAGKTDIAALIARENGWDILSCDSRQLYRGMTIGTAKPDASMRASVRHWLIDVLDPDVSYSAWDFAREAGAIIRGRAERGRSVLVCGGTGLYFECLRKGIAPQTASDPIVRDRFQRRAELEGSSALHAELNAIDPASARRIHGNDLQRIVRALAVYEQTGKPMSEIHRRTTPPADLEFVVAVIVPPRDELYGRIDRRVDQMAAQGLYNEFLLLVSMGFDERCPGMQCIGYRELFPVKRGERSLTAAIELIKLNTRHFAKRQCAWFKAHNGGETVLWSADRDTLLRNVTCAIVKPTLV